MSTTSAMTASSTSARTPRASQPSTITAVPPMRPLVLGGDPAEHRLERALFSNYIKNLENVNLGVLEERATPRVPSFAGAICRCH